MLGDMHYYIDWVDMHIMDIRSARRFSTELPALYYTLAAAARAGHFEAAGHFAHAHG